MGQSEGGCIVVENDTQQNAADERLLPASVGCCSPGQQSAHIPAKWRQSILPEFLFFSEGFKLSFIDFVDFYDCHVVVDLFPVPPLRLSRDHLWDSC